VKIVKSICTSCTVQLNVLSLDSDTPSRTSSGRPGNPFFHATLILMDVTLHSACDLFSRHAAKGLQPCIMVNLPPAPPTSTRRQQHEGLPFFTATVFLPPTFTTLPSLLFSRFWPRAPGDPPSIPLGANALRSVRMLSTMGRRNSISRTTPSPPGAPPTHRCPLGSQTCAGSQGTCTQNSSVQYTLCSSLNAV